MLIPIEMVICYSNVILFGTKISKNRDCKICRVEKKKHLVKRKQDGGKKKLKNKEFDEKTNERNTKNAIDAKREISENFHKWDVSGALSREHLKQAQLRSRIRIKSAEPNWNLVAEGNQLT